MRKGKIKVREVERGEVPNRLFYRQLLAEIPAARKLNQWYLLAEFASPFQKRAYWYRGRLAADRRVSGWEFRSLIRSGVGRLYCRSRGEAS